MDLLHLRVSQMKCLPIYLKHTSEFVTNLNRLSNELHKRDRVKKKTLFEKQFTSCVNKEHRDSKVKPEHLAFFSRFRF